MQRTKGAVYEREVMKTFSAALGREFKRNIGQARDGGNDGDVGPLVLEMKRRGALPKTLMGWYQQALDAANPHNHTIRTRVPIVVMREDNGESMVLLSLSDFISLTRDEIGSFFDDTTTESQADGARD
jgi:hypothetical protein